MPMGITPESLRDMSIQGLRELHSIADQMSTLSTVTEYRSEYGALAGLVQAQIREREVGAATTIQTAIRERKERDANRAEDEERIRRAKARLEEEGIAFDYEPGLVSTARLYHLATVLEAFDAVASKNPYLTTRPGRKVKRTQLPSRPLQDEFDGVSRDLGGALEGIQGLVDQRIAAIKEADRAARMVIIPGDLLVNGALVDRGTYIYPGAGAIRYNNARTYLLAPNRALIHVKDEIPPAATPQLAGQYLAALVAGCRALIQAGGCDGRDGEKIRIDGFLPSGGPFFWNMIGKKNASMQGYAGEIYHIDSGYANSRWLNE